MVKTRKKYYSSISTDSMMFKKYLAAITGYFLLFNLYGFSTIQSAEFNQAQIEILPLTSFLFANRDSMRAGWHRESINKGVKNLKSVTKKPVGSLFVQLKPRLNEGEYQLALRVLKDGSHQFCVCENLLGVNHLITKFT